MYDLIIFVLRTLTTIMKVRIAFVAFRAVAKITETTGRINALTVAATAGIGSCILLGIIASFVAHGPV
jgi:hypothetical protein